MDDTNVEAPTGGQDSVGDGSGGPENMADNGPPNQNNFVRRNPPNRPPFQRRGGFNNNPRFNNRNMNDAGFKRRNFGRPQGQRGDDHGGGPRDMEAGERDNRFCGERDNRFSGDRDNRFADKLNEKLAQIAGPAVDLPPLETVEKKFSGRNRLYIGNLSQEVTEDDLKDNLGKCGEFCELFVNKERNFAFVKFDYYANAEKAKRELDGMMLKGKNLKVRIAPNNAMIKVKNLSNFVSNELLNYAFQVFGEVERALVLVDERGKPTGEGIVEFARKGCALNAVKKCTDRCFFLTESLRPIIVEPFEYVNDQDGFPEKLLPKRSADFMKARSKGPRLAELNSFEHEYGVRWKQLIELYNQKEEALKKELLMEKDKLEAQMEFARYEHETEQLREELRAREMGRDRQKQEWELKERQVEEQKRRNEEQIRRQEETLQARMLRQEEEMRRRQQENNLFVQAHQLHNMLEEQEQQTFSQNTPEPFINNNADNDDNPGNGGGGIVGGMIFEQPNPRGGFHGGNRGGGRYFGRDRWVTDRRDEGPMKRRRFF